MPTVSEDRFDARDDACRTASAPARAALARRGRNDARRGHGQRPDGRPDLAHAGRPRRGRPDHGRPAPTARRRSRSPRPTRSGSRASPADQLANLNQTRTVTLDGIPTRSRPTGQFLEPARRAPASCASSAAAADYAKITSTVDWPANNRTPIVVSSVDHPAGGRLAGRPGARPERRPAARACGQRAGTDSRTTRCGPPRREHRRGRLRDLRRPAGRRLQRHRRAWPATSTQTATRRPTSRVTTTAGNTSNLAVHARPGRAGHRELQDQDRQHRRSPEGARRCRGPTPAWPHPGVARRRPRPDVDDDSPKTLFPFIDHDAGRLHQQLHGVGGPLHGREAAARREPVARRRSAPGATATRRTGVEARCTMPALDMVVTTRRRAARTRGEAGAHRAHRLLRPDLAARRSTRDAASRHHGLAELPRAAIRRPTRSAPTTTAPAAITVGNSKVTLTSREHELHGGEHDDRRDRHASTTGLC